MSSTRLLDSTGRKKAANVAGLPGPLEDMGPLEKVAQIGLMGDDQSRYSGRNADRVVSLPKRTVEGLIERFGSRLRAIPFTAEGVPSDEEGTLARDIWTALPPTDRKSIVDNTTKMVSEGRLEVPDQTPYAIRLFHRYMWMKAKEN